MFNIDSLNSGGLTLDPYQGITGLDDQYGQPVDTSIFGGSGGGDYSGSTVLGANTGNSYSTAPDPYASFGGKAAYDNLISGFNTQKANIGQTSNEAATSSASGLHSSILDYLNGLTTSQNNINESGVQNELAKKQGMNSVMDLVSQGLQSGGVLLANRNASDSSASEALARAYGKIGQRQAGQVGQQYEQGNRKIGIAQEELGRSKNLGKTKLDESKSSAINNIVSDARSRLAQLDADMSNANIAERFQIEQEKQAIQNSVSGILSQYDNELNTGMGNINPTSTDARRLTANELANKGTAASNPFDFTTTPDAQFQGTGPFAAELPIFSAPRKRTA